MSNGLVFWSLEWSLWLLSLVASLLGLYAWLSSVILLSRMLLKDAWRNYWRKRASDARTTTRMGFTGIEVIGLCLMVGAVSFVTGWMARDVKQFNHTATYYSLRVLTHPANNIYKFQLAGGTSVIKFCDDYLVDLDTGSTLEWITWEDRGTCKSVSQGGFKVVRLNTGKPVITAVVEGVP